MQGKHHLVVVISIVFVFSLFSLPIVFAQNPVLDFFRSFFSIGQTTSQQCFWLPNPNLACGQGCPSGQRLFDQVCNGQIQQSECRTDNRCAVSTVAQTSCEWIPVGDCGVGCPAGQRLNNYVCDGSVYSSECISDSSCVVPQTHLECRDEACVSVSGPGPDQCNHNDQCRTGFTPTPPPPTSCAWEPIGCGVGCINTERYEEYRCDGVTYNRRCVQNAPECAAGPCQWREATKIGGKPIANRCGADNLCAKTDVLQECVKSDGSIEATECVRESTCGLPTDCKTYGYYNTRSECNAACVLRNGNCQEIGVYSNTCYECVVPTTITTRIPATPTTTKGVSCNKANPDVNIEDNGQSIKPSQTTNYKIKIKNNDDCKSTFDLSASVQTGIEVKFGKDKIIDKIDIDSKQEETVTLAVATDSNLQPGQYKIQISIINEEDKSKSTTTDVNLNVEQREYLGTAIEESAVSPQITTIKTKNNIYEAYIQTSVECNSVFYLAKGKSVISKAVFSFDPSIRFQPIKSGRVKIIAFCFEPVVKIYRTAIEVV